MANDRIDAGSSSSHAQRTDHSAPRLPGNNSPASRPSTPIQGNFTSDDITAKHEQIFGEAATHQNRAFKLLSNNIVRRAVALTTGIATHQTAQALGYSHNTSLAAASAVMLAVDGAASTISDIVNYQNEIAGNEDRPTTTSDASQISSRQKLTAIHLIAKTDEIDMDARTKVRDFLGDSSGDIKNLLKNVMEGNDDINSEAFLKSDVIVTLSAMKRAVNIPERQNEITRALSTNSPENLRTLFGAVAGEVNELREMSGVPDLESMDKIDWKLVREVFRKIDSIAAKFMEGQQAR